MKLYYEVFYQLLGGRSAEPVYYFHEVDNAVHLYAFNNLQITQYAERIWSAHKNGNIEFTKNRHDGPTAKVDKTELFWINT